MKKILLSDGIHEAVVSDCDYSVLIKRNWHYSQGYAKGNLSIQKKRYSLPMHNYIAGHCVKPREYMIDHINRNRLDNRRENLRVVSKSVNCHNSGGPTRRNHSGYRGVHLHKASGLWKANIRVNNFVHELGYFKDPKKASEVYEAKKQELLGDVLKTCAA